jgi:DNA-binding NarL/FixJ family response regulator
VPAPAHSLRSRLNHPLLLLVEEELAHAQLLKETVQLINPSWDVVHCRTGSDALDHIEKPGNDFALAIVDLKLPDIGGLDIVRAWRKRYTNHPLLVISAVMAERAVLEAIRVGANGYLLKSTDVNHLSYGIHQVLEGNNPISPVLARHLFKLAGAPQTRKPHPIHLTTKERETLQHINRGHSYAESARLMGVSVSTVQTHIRSLYRKLNAHSQIQAIVKARDCGLL